MHSNSPRVVVFLHPNIESVATLLPDLLFRLNDYSQGLQHRSNSKNRLHLLIGISKSRFLNLDHTKYLALSITRIANRSFFPIFFSIKVYFFIRKHLKSQQQLTLIAGDLRASLIPLFFGKLMFGNRVRTQISIHGKFLMDRQRFNWKHLIINRTMMFAIQKSDSIRVVSNHLASEIERMGPELRRKIFISPVPILMNIHTNSTLKLSTNTIAIVGRLHPERGVIGALNLVEVALRSNTEMKLVVVGKGPLEFEITEWILNSNLGDRIEFIGELAQAQVIDLWTKVDILISNAEAEGYGMALREAALHGCRVVAKRNLGTENLAAEYGDAIFLYSSVEEFVACLESAYSLRNKPIDTFGLREMQYSLDSDSRALLIDSWLAD
jgi:glycosyltransferase involved in cell wall biosynthesis